jgi:S-adenosylmethionine:tRNA ribosyltransferase-isomerase
MPHQPYMLSDFDYVLPEGLIAQQPEVERGASRLLHVAGDARSDGHFADLPALMRAGDLLVFNDTRVIKARLHGEKESGGQVEVLVERVLDDHHALAQVRASHAPRPGGLLRFAGGLEARVEARDGRMVRLSFLGGESVFSLLERHGEVPLPPYIRRAADDRDEARYQTVYARTPGAVAAPTAGLHFDGTMLERLREQGVQGAYITLHVGAGTFQPVQSEQLDQHVMHAEWFSVPVETANAIAATRAAGGRIVAVGTTALRALESAADESGGVRSGEGDTRLFITPGYRFRVVERLLTNFHLPRSTLLMLVSAFAGYDEIRAAYAHAIERRYRFFSYGDAMLLERRDPS